MAGHAWLQCKEKTTVEEEGGVGVRVEGRREKGKETIDLFCALRTHTGVVDVSDLSLLCGGEGEWASG